MKINRTVQRALLVLDKVASEPDGVTLSDLEKALELPKTSLFDIVSTMVSMRYLRKHDKLFFIGIKSKNIASAYVKKQDICDIAEPILVQASELNHASSSLVMLSNSNLDYCFQYHPEDAIMIARTSSPYNILHASATGKVLLAYMQPSRRESILKKIHFHKFTDRTIDNMDDLLGVVSVVREQGYALDDREFHYLLQCVAAPVYHKKRVIAAISFSGLNLYSDDPSKMIAQVLETARKISESYDLA